MQGESGRPSVAGPRFRLACAVCGCRFVLAEPAYQLYAGIVECPSCGSLDLVLLEDERSRCERAGLER